MLDVLAPGGALRQVEWYVVDQHQFPRGKLFSTGLRGAYQVNKPALLDASEVGDLDLDST